MQPVNNWPRDITSWIKNRTLHISVPFTWLLTDAANLARQQSMLWDDVLIGGPAVDLQLHRFDSQPWVKIGHDCEGVLQRVNWQATKSTTGCPNSCPFCAVPKIEGAFQELDDWPDLPVYIDNNLLAASQQHLDRVFDRLERWGWADFNQGLDARKLNDYHAERINRIKKPMVRLALDNMGYQKYWSRAFDTLRRHGIAKHKIRAYALIGFNTGPDEAWNRCQWIENHGVKPLPMWFHELDAREPNIVTDKQRELGWNDFERRRIMRWYYQHRETKR